MREISEVKNITTPQICSIGLNEEVLSCSAIKDYEPITKKTAAYFYTCDFLKLNKDVSVIVLIIAVVELESCMSEVKTSESRVGNPGEISELHFAVCMNEECTSLAYDSASCAASLVEDTRAES